MQDENAMMDDDDKMAKQGNYITLADFKKDMSKYKDNAKIYFFHATWCPVCQSVNKAIEADPSKIPAGATIIKTDFDKETELRQKYGVTYQYTFVQVDNDGNQIKKWSASNLNDVVDGIQL
jgi:thiol-disulfide isomerase/thioredoxin